MPLCSQPYWTNFTFSIILGQLLGVIQIVGLRVKHMRQFLAHPPDLYMKIILLQFITHFQQCNFVMSQFHLKMVNILTWSYYIKYDIIININPMNMNFIIYKQAALKFTTLRGLYFLIVGCQVTLLLRWCFHMMNISLVLQFRWMNNHCTPYIIMPPHKLLGGILVSFHLSGRPSVPHPVSTL